MTALEISNSHRHSKRLSNRLQCWIYSRLALWIIWTHLTALQKTPQAHAALSGFSFLCPIHNYTEYNKQWNVFSAFNPSKCAHTWSSGQPTLRPTGSRWGFGALLKGLTSVVDNSCRSRDSNPQPRVTSPTLYPLGHGCGSFRPWCFRKQSIISQFI